MKVVVVAEYYPRVSDPALGVWAHRQALAARDAGAEVEVLVLHRPVPSKEVVARLAAALGVEPEHFREYRLRVIADRLEEMPDLVDRLYKRLAV